MKRRWEGRHGDWLIVINEGRPFDGSAAPCRVPIPEPLPILKATGCNRGEVYQNLRDQIDAYEAELEDAGNVAGDAGRRDD
jgi:hypothetical protein